MIDHKPLVSIGMPVFNESRHIAESVESLLTQTFRDFELIVSDNASTDNTVDIVQQYASDDRRIRLVANRENRGATWNFLSVCGQARGDFFLWAGGHDLWAANFLDAMLRVLSSGEGVVLAVPQAQWINESGATVRISSNIIDTRGAPSPASRILSMFQNMDRCNAIYGLHRRQTLSRTFPWPRVIGPDFIGLVRIAALGDVVTNVDTWWGRRMVRRETREETVARQLTVLQVTGCAARFPYLASRARTMYEFARADGTIQERFDLLRFGFDRLFGQQAQRRLLAAELRTGLFALLHSH